MFCALALSEGMRVRSVKMVLRKSEGWEEDVAR
jgi:hypothetical protein